MTIPALSPEATALLPVANEAPRCSDFSLALEVAPQGTALAVAMVVLVETPLPWPKPIFDHERLAGFDNLIDSIVGPARILATIPTAGRDTPIKVTCFWHDGSGSHGAVLAVADPVALRDCIDELGRVTPDTSSFLITEPAPERAVLVCTHGTHDVCCGADGTRLAAQLELSRPDIRVYRISHTGGHKFAPSVLTIPDGRMWARLTADEVEAIVDRSGHPADVAAKCRGWWGAANGPAQVGEIAVFANQGWDCDSRPQSRSIAVTPVDDSSFDVVVSDGSTQWQVRVDKTRVLPAIACRAEGGLPAKPAPEFRATLIA